MPPSRQALRGRPGRPERSVRTPAPFQTSSVPSSESRAARGPLLGAMGPACGAGTVSNGCQGGIPLDHLGATWAFPQTDPLSEGLGGLDWNAGDFRVSLQGLLWVLEDGERVLTVVHPATAQVIYLPLPRGDDFELAFEPTRLVLKAGQGPGGHPQAWALPWLALLPQFARLGPPAVLPIKGTALKPFPMGQ